jgi:Spy/CpxP family protein refolding chaperone
MTRIRAFAFAAAGLLAAAGAIAQQQPDPKAPSREGGSMMEGCREMMKDGGMMGRGTGESRPNEQWRKSEPRK